MSTLNVRLPEALEARLADEARLARRSRSELAREAIRRYLVELERDRFRTELSHAAHAIGEDPALRADALAIAEEFAPLEEENTREDHINKDDPWWK